MESTGPLTIGSHTRVAWLFPSLARAYYWQPVFKEFVARCPCTAVFTCDWPGFAPGFENSIAVHTLPGLGYVDLKKRLPDVRYGFIWTPLSIIRKLAAFGPDVVFASGFSGWTACALLFRLVRDAQVIILFDGCSAHALGKFGVQTVLRRWIAMLADAAVTNTEDGMCYLRDVIGMPRDKILCHPYQVPDLGLLSSGGGELPLPGRRPVFLYVGGLNWRKGWQYLIEASALLARRGVRDFSVLFVGEGEQAEAMRAAVRDYGLGDIVRQAGAVAYHNLGLYYRNADVFVSPTRSDVWGVAVLEAMAFGKPVLCSKYAGSSQMVAHGENGFIFDPSDTQQLADYMTRFILDENLVKRMGVRALEAMAPFTPARAAEALANLALQPNQPAPWLRRQKPTEIAQTSARAD